MKMLKGYHIMYIFVIYQNKKFVKIKTLLILILKFILLRTLLDNKNQSPIRYLKTLFYNTILRKKE